MIFLDPMVWVLIGLVATLAVVSTFFEWFWKVFPFAERHPLVMWAGVMTLFLLFGILVS
jgi:uncharacterized membrane protein